MARDLITYNPFRAIDEFEKRIFREPFAPYNLGADAGVFKTDIKEEDDKFVLEADLPGFAKDDISLDVDNEILTISAQRHSEHEEADKRDKYVRCERSYGSYSRSFDISAVDADKIEAAYENGVLTLTMPKKEALVPKKMRLEIK